MSSSIRSLSFTLLWTAFLLCSLAPVTAARTRSPTRSPTPTPTPATPTPTPTPAVTTAAPGSTEPAVCGINIRPDGLCGIANGNAGCAFGSCCSQYGYCGATAEYCSSSMKFPCPASTTSTCNATTLWSGCTYSLAETCGPKKIALTFDDGPNLGTSGIIAAIQKYNIPATVFVNKNNYDSELTAGPNGSKCSTLRELVALGVEIHSHSSNHSNYTSPEYTGSNWNATIYSDLTSLASWLNQTCNITAPIKFFRPPFGNLNQNQGEYIYKKFGYTIAMWNVDTLDWSNSTNSSIKAQLDSQMPAASSGLGAIVLAHDHHSGIAVPGSTTTPAEFIIDYLYKNYVVAAGYTFVGITDCFNSCNSWRTTGTGKYCASAAGSSTSSWQ